VAAFAGVFGDVPEDDETGPLLPPEDRLWRHPSELSGVSPSLPLDPVAVRRRWQQSQPSKASAWTAGLVGALLATGLVALGTHLATALTSQPSTGIAPAVESPLVSQTTVASVGPAVLGLGAGLTAMVKGVGAATASVDAWSGRRDRHLLALVVRSDGMLVAPAALVAHATSLVVTLPDGVEYVGDVLGIDRASGVALLHINGVSALPTVTLAADEPLRARSFAVAVTSPGGTTATVGSLRALNASPRVGGVTLVDAMTTDLPAATSVPGSALVDGSGAVIGFVLASGRDGVVATPSWLAAPIAEELMATQSVVSGSLGVATTAVSDGARVTAVAATGAAKEAGIEVGDVIVAVDGEAVSSASALAGHLHILKPETTVAVEILRGGSSRTVVARLDDGTAA
jgi:S1-C subfamily serine protease